jgi:hypothetical protein
MVTLQQVSSVTVTSPWSDYNTGVTNALTVTIVNPFYPVFIFNYINTSNCGLWVIGYVSGDNAGTVFNHTCGWLTLDGSFYFDVFGYPYAMTGGYLTGVSSCANNGEFWWAFVNQNTGALNVYCSGWEPSNTVTEQFIAVVADLVQSNILVLSRFGPKYAFVIWIIPVTEISTLLNNSPPSSMKFAVVNTVNVPGEYMMNFYPVIYNGNLIVATESYAVIYFAVMPLSDIYINAMSGVPTSSTPVTTIGTDYEYNEYEFESYPIVTVIAIPSGNSISVYISFISQTRNQNFYVANLSPSNFSVVSSYTTTFQAEFYTWSYSTYNGVFIIISITTTNNVPTLYVYAFDPKSGSCDNTSISISSTSVFAGISYEGYLVVSQQPLNNTTVTFVIYQVLLDHTYVFQNVAVSTTSSTITFSGVLYDETAGAPVANATVWLVAVRSYVKQYSNDVVPLASTTTDSAGHFTVSAPMQSGYNAYGVLYTP